MIPMLTPVHACNAKIKQASASGHVQNDVGRGDIPVHDVHGLAIGMPRRVCMVESLQDINR